MVIIFMFIEVYQIFCFTTEKLHERVQNIVAKAYSNIKIEEFARLLGISEQNAIEGISIKHIYQLLSNVFLSLQVY